MMEMLASSVEDSETSNCLGVNGCVGRDEQILHLSGHNPEMLVYSTDIALESHTIVLLFISPQVVVVLWEPQDGITIRDIGVGLRIEHVLKENCCTAYVRKLKGNQCVFPDPFSHMTSG